MSVAIITGSSGLIGSESALAFSARGLDVVGIDNDMRGALFGREASTRPVAEYLRAACPGIRLESIDIRDEAAIGRIFERYGRSVAVVVHAAAQPSHEWAARDPRSDFAINAGGTLNLLEATRAHCPDAVFIFSSTNKVYGDTPNRLPLVERDTRLELDTAHPFHAFGIDESMSIDQSMHSLFGASKAAADLMAQEYGRYFGIKTASFRCGCVAGPRHAGAELHGFLAYMMKCAATGRIYRIFGHAGKQVRDNLHSADLIQAFLRFFDRPRIGEVYNMGGSRRSHCSVREALALCEEIVGRPVRTSQEEASRRGDHRWYVSDVRKFQSHYPGWKVERDVPAILREIYEANQEIWREEQA